MRRAVAGAAMGNAIEWFDYAIYGYLATTIGLVFFPEADEAAQRLLVFAGIASRSCCGRSAASSSARSATSSAAAGYSPSRSS